MIAAGAGRIGGARRWLRLLVPALLAVLLLWTGPGAPLLAQVQPAAPTTADGVQADGTGAIVPPPGAREVQTGPIGPGLFRPTPEDDSRGLDYDDWTALALRAEAALANDRSGASELDALRALLVDWREALLGAQSANSTRIAVIRAQIAALGPPPAEGMNEAEEIAGRRSELTDQLVRLQAPGIKADEAYERADGLILEIDRQRRERQAEELLRLWPAPVNPANWPTALVDLSEVALTLWSETAARIADPRAQRTLVDNLPLVLGLLLFFAVALWRGQPWLDRALDRLPLAAGGPAARAARTLTSVGQIALPVLSCIALSVALRRSGLVGPLGEELARAVVPVGLVIASGIWLGARLFRDDSPLREVSALPVERWAEGRFLLFACGLLLALARVRGVVLGQLDLSAEVASVTLFPILLFAGLVLIRIGRLVAAMMAPSAVDEDDRAALRGIGRLIGKALVAIGVVGPLLGAVGYNAAAAALVQPATVSIGLIGLLMLIQQLLFDLWALATRQWTDPDKTLVPVLLSFALALASLPVFALVWGADVADLTELWARVQSGFTLGETRISLTDFLLFATIFVIGYTATRVLQGVLKGQILPRIGMDQGGRNAIAVGTGYIGIFLSALVAINATGIDLSGLAIVAGALSVGIGFGLQAIVSNFVSGIILLIERPVSEGDWIEVGTVQGIVKSISVRSTRIQTFDYSDVIVPNQDLITGRVTNWTRYSQAGRIVVPVNVAQTSDGRQVARILTEIAAALPQALRNPPPQVALMGFPGEAMAFEVRVILKDINTMVQARSDLNHEILARFHKEGIAFTSAHRDHLARLAEVAAEAQELAQREAELAGWLSGAAPEAEPQAAPAPHTAGAGPEPTVRRRKPREGTPDAD
ncbi:MAG: DUF3772 domain-containing protein [Paracoccaceae bacterium]